MTDLNKRTPLPGRYDGLSSFTNGATTSPRKKIVAAPYLFALLLALAVICLSLQDGLAPDLFWQIRCGNDVLVSGPPHHDVYSWTCAGRRWDVNEWLSFVMFALAYHSTGSFVGPFLLMELLLIILGVSFYLSLLAETRIPALSCALSLCVITGIRFDMQCRPYVFSYILTVITTALVVRVVSLRTDIKWLVPIPALFILWANLHQGVVVGVGLVALLGCARIAEARFLQPYSSTTQRTLQAATMTLAASLLALIATVATPYGFGLYHLIWVTVSDPGVSRYIAEWKPLTFRPNIESASFVLLAACIMAAVIHGWRNRRPNFGPTSVFVISFVEALLHRRNVPIALIVSTIVFGGEIANLAKAFYDKLLVRLTESNGVNGKLVLKFGSTAILCAYLFYSVYSANVYLTHMPTYDSKDALQNVADVQFGLEEFPFDACQFMNYCQFPDDLRWFNDYNLGGMMIMCRPRDRVFIDGRDDVYQGPLFDQYFPDLLQSGLAKAPSAAYTKFLDNYDFDAAITKDVPTALYFAKRSDYTLVFVHKLAPITDPTSENCWIFVRRRPKFKSLISNSRQIWADHEGGTFPHT